MKSGMARAYWYLLPLSAVLGAPLACSSSEADPKITPPPPSGGSAGSPSGGGAGGGGAGSQGGSAGNTSSGSGGGGAVCTPATAAADCPTGGFCKMGGCACPADKLDICTGANVGGGANGLCTSKMADPENCGECGMKCEAGAACVAGVCGAPPTDVVTSEGCGSMRLVIQGTNVYWTESMSGKVRTAPLAGGAATDIATGQLNPTQIAADADGIYWVNQGDATAGSSTVMKKPLPGAGAAEELVASPDTVKLLTLAVGGGKVYYSHGSNIHAVSTEDGSGDMIVATATNFDLNPPDGMPSGEPAGLVVNGTKLFWTTATRQGVEGDGTAVGLDAYVELGESQGNLLHQDIATDGTNGYWVDGPKVQRAPMKPPVEVTSTPDFDDIAAFTMNATDVYFVTKNGKLYKHGINPPATPDAAVPPTLLARDQVMANSIVLDATKAYWSSGCTIRTSGL